MINKLHLAMIDLYSGDAKRIQHFCKVHSYAKLIAETEKVDDRTLLIIETAALTHDIGIHTCEEKYGRVQYLIAHHHTYDDINSIDYQILVEADFLVNMMEDNLPKQTVENAYNKVSYKKI
mgnify:CR=1 FL=1